MANCLYCNKPLIQKKDEKPWNFQRRSYCNKFCAKIRENSIRPTQKGMKNMKGLMSLDPAGQPDIEHSLQALKSREVIQAMPLHRTEEQIDMYHEYWTMMGHRR
jgi:hypothetical protein